MPRTSSQTGTPRKTAGQRLKQVQRTAILLKQLSDPTRLTIVVQLLDGEMNVGALCDLVNMTQAAVSHHLALLRYGEIVKPRRDGKQVFYTLTDAGTALGNAARAIIG